MGHFLDCYSIVGQTNEQSPSTSMENSSPALSRLFIKIPDPENLMVPVLAKMGLMNDIALLFV
jgi:hypothetical protein